MASAKRSTKSKGVVKKAIGAVDSAAASVVRRVRHAVEAVTPNPPRRKATKAVKKVKTAVARRTTKAATATKRLATKTKRVARATVKRTVGKSAPGRSPARRKARRA